MSSRRATRRAALGVLAGLGGYAVLTAARRATDRWTTVSASAPKMPAFPAWVSSTRRSRQAYEAAYGNLDLMASLPCYCGCAALPRPHASLRECFVQPSGHIEQHAAGCETCQDEAIDAVAWSDAGMSWLTIHDRIVAAYSDRGPGSPGHRGLN